jgi:hypothetical protein
MRMIDNEEEEGCGMKKSWSFKSYSLKCLRKTTKNGLESQSPNHDSN